MHIDKIKNVVYRIKACSPHDNFEKHRIAQPFELFKSSCSSMAASMLCTSWLIFATSAKLFLKVWIIQGG